MRYARCAVGLEELSGKAIKWRLFTHFSPHFLNFDRKSARGTPAAHIRSMMTAVFIWMGLSLFATLGIVSSLALGSRRHIPTINNDTGNEPMLILNRGVAGGDAKLATSFAQ